MPRDPHGVISSRLAVIDHNWQPSNQQRLPTLSIAGRAGGEHGDDLDCFLADGRSITWTGKQKTIDPCWHEPAGPSLGAKKKAHMALWTRPWRPGSGVGFGGPAACEGANMIIGIQECHLNMAAFQPEVTIFVVRT